MKTVALAAVIASGAFLVGATPGKCAAQSAGKQFRVRVDLVSFVHFDREHLRIVGTSFDGRVVAIPLAAHRTSVFGLTSRIADLRPGDDVGIRSTFDDAGRLVTSELTVNVHTIDAEIVAFADHGFTFHLLNYYTGVPLVGSNVIGLATLLPGVAVDPPSALAVGDRTKLYGFRRAKSPRIFVYRLEDRGR